MHDHNNPDDICIKAAEMVGEIVGALQPGAMMTKFYLVATIIDETGETGLWTQSSHGLAPWDTLGLLEFAKETESAKIFRRETEG